MTALRAEDGAPDATAELRRVQETAQSTGDSQVADLAAAALATVADPAVR